jgi:hypothetical protein
MSDELIKEYVYKRVDFNPTMGNGSLTFEKIGTFNDGFIVKYKLKKGEREFNGTFAVSLTEIRDWQINKII